MAGRQEKASGASGSTGGATAANPDMIDENGERYSDINIEAKCWLVMLHHCFTNLL